MLTALRRRYPQIRFVWLRGSDNLASFDRWHRWADIAARVPIAVIQRPGSLLAALNGKAMQRFASRRVHDDLATARPPAIAIVDGRRNAQSSTALRAQGSAL